MSDKIWDYVNSILYTNKYQIIEDEREYVPFFVNKALSQYKDLIFYANEINQNHFIDKKLHYDHLFYLIPKRNRYSGKWSKKVVTDDVMLLSKYYGMSWQKAKDALKILSKEQLKFIKKEMEEGGVINE